MASVPRSLWIVLIVALLAAAVWAPSCGEGSAALWPDDPVAMRLARTQRNVLESAGSGRARGDGRHREMLSDDLSDIDREHWREEVIASELSSGPLLLLRELLEGRDARKMRSSVTVKWATSSTKLLL